MTKHAARTAVSLSTASLTSVVLGARSGAEGPGLQEQGTQGLQLSGTGASFSSWLAEQQSGSPPPLVLEAQEHKQTDF